MICVPVTLLSLSYCLPLLRRLATAQRRLRGEPPFHLKLHSAAGHLPSSEGLQTGRDNAHTFCHPHATPGPPEQGRVPPPETVCIQLFWSVGDLFTCRSRFLLPTSLTMQEERK